MGIRYYAYAFDADMTERALADPRSMLSADPLADAWGMEPGFTIGATDFTQAVPKRDMLYLDKAWGLLQQLTAPATDTDETRPAHLMFEGRVTYNDDWGWDGWVRALTPEQVVEIAPDLDRIGDDEVKERLRGCALPDGRSDAEARYALQYLGKAREFVAGLAAEGRGMVYLIG